MGSLRDTFSAVHLEKQQIAVTQPRFPDVLKCEEQRRRLLTAEPKGRRVRSREAETQTESALLCLSASRLGEF